MADDQLLQEHLVTWHWFVKLLTRSLIGIIIVLILMGIFLV